MLALSLSFMSGAHIYFAGYASCLVLPLVVVLSANSWAKHKVRIFNLILAVVILIGGGIGTYSNLMEATASIENIKVTSSDQYSFLRKLGNQVDELDFMVYIHPEHPFWKSCNLSTAFQIPLLTNRPALRGLVYCRGWSSRNYYWWSRGYPTYSREEFEIAQAPNPGAAALCREVISKGFSGYYEILDNSLSRRILC